MNDTKKTFFPKIRQLIINFFTLIGATVSLLFLLIIIYFVIVEIYISIRNRSNSQSSLSAIKSNNITSYPTATVTITPTPTKTPKTVLNMPINENWVRYEAKCPMIKNNLIIYYPESWKVSLDGEQSVGDYVPDPSLECFISFGYPVAPAGRQDPFYGGLVGYITLSVFKDSEFNDLDSWVNFILENYHGIIALNKANINGKTFIKYAGNSFSESNYYDTFHNGVIVRLHFQTLGYQENLSPLSLGLLLQKYEQLINKLQFK